MFKWIARLIFRKQINLLLYEKGLAELYAERCVVFHDNQNEMYFRGQVEGYTYSLTQMGVRL